MVNRVFIYSKREAKKNKINMPILQLVLVFVMLMIFTIICPILNLMNYLPIIMSLFSIALMYYSILLGLRMRFSNIAYATDTSGNLYKVVSLTNTNGANRNLVKAAIAVNNYVSSTRFIQNPNEVAKIIENKEFVNGILIYEITHVYEIEESRGSYKVRCDYEISNNHSKKINKTIRIYKSVNGSNDLSKVLENLK